MRNLLLIPLLALGLSGCVHGPHGPHGLYHGPRAAYAQPVYVDNSRTYVTRGTPERRHHKPERVVVVDRGGRPDHGLHARSAPPPHHKPRPAAVEHRRDDRRGPDHGRPPASYHSGRDDRRGGNHGRSDSINNGRGPGRHGR